MWEQYKTAKKNGADMIEYEITFHRYLSNPILFISVFLLAMIFGNTKPRDGNFFKIILQSIILNFAIYLLITIIQQLLYLNLSGVFLLLYVPKITLMLILMRKAILYNF